MNRLAPPFSIAQVIIPATMKIPGMLKLRNFRMPIVNVNATATSA